MRFKRIDRAEDALRAIADEFWAEGTQKDVLGKRLGELSQPLQVIWDERDQIIPSSHARRLPDHVETTVIGDAGHMVQMESATQVNRPVLALVT